MKNTPNCDGSALLVIVLLISFISLVCINIWRITAVAFDIALQKQKYEITYQGLKGVFNWAQHVCKNNFDAIFIKTNNKDLKYTIGEPTSNSNTYKVYISNQSPDALQIKVVQKEFPNRYLECIVQKNNVDEITEYMVKTWHYSG